MKKRLFYVIMGLCITGFLVGGVGLSFAQQDKYPSKSIEVIIPYDPGGPTDIVSRIVVEKLPEFLNTSVVPINKPGGGGIAGAVYAKQQKPDGYTLLAHASGFHITPLLDKSCPYKLEEFKALTRFSRGPLVLAVRKDSPWKNMEDFVAAVKAAPGKVTVGIPGAGTIHDFVIRLIELSVKNDLNPITFKGDGPSLTALLGGHIQASLAGLSALTPHLRSGDLRGIALTAPERHDVFTDIPTFKEKGMDDATLFAWVGIFTPGGLPDPVFKILDSACEKAATHPAVIEALKKAGTTPGYMNSTEFDKSIKSEVDRLKMVIKPGEIK